MNSKQHRHGGFRRRGWALFALGATLLTTSAYATEDDIFDVDNFLDPRSLGAEMQVGAPTKAGAKFDLFSASAGHVGKYQDRSTFTGDDRQFVNVDYSRHWSDWQLSGGATLMNHRADATARRAKLSLGKYSLNRSMREDEDEFIARWRLSAVVDNRLDLGTQYEIGYSMFVELPKFLARARGGASISYRGGAGVREIRALWNSSRDFWHFAGDRGRGNGSLWLGYEHADGHDRLAPIKLRVLIEYRVVKDLEIHVSYAPAYRFASEGLDRKLNNEWMAALYLPFGAAIGY